MLQLGHVELFAADTEAARDFYVDILGARLVSDQRPYFWVAFGEREILLRPGAGPRADTYGGAGTALVLYTDDLPAALARLAHAGLEPTAHDGCPECPVFQDPDGHWIQIVNPDA